MTAKNETGAGRGLALPAISIALLGAIAIYSAQTGGAAPRPSATSLPEAAAAADQDPPKASLDATAATSSTNLTLADIAPSQNAADVLAQSDPGDPEVTFSEEVSGEKKQAGVSGYVLGAEGASPDMRRAWETLARARGAESEMDAGKPLDPRAPMRAAEEIGYVPAGVDPSTIRDPSDPIGARNGRVVSGAVEVVTAGLLVVNGELVRLQGLRAPTSEDACRTASGKSYDCDAWSSKALETLIASRDLDCELTEKTVGPESAPIGWCSIVLRSGVRRDLGQLEVEAGIAIADGSETGISPYLRSAQKARRNEVGLWAGSMSTHQNEETEK